MYHSDLLYHAVLCTFSHERLHPHIRGTRLALVIFVGFSIPGCTETSIEAEQLWSQIAWQS